LEYLVENTQNGKLRWEPTARALEFTTALRGKYSAVVQRDNQGTDRLRLENSDGEVMLSIHESQSDYVEALWELARRNAYSVDTAIDEILGGSS
jgi:hypothetical protein